MILRVMAAAVTWSPRRPAWPRRVGLSLLHPSNPEAIPIVFGNPRRDRKWKWLKVLIASWQCLLENFGEAILCTAAKCNPARVWSTRGSLLRDISNVQPPISTFEYQKAPSPPPLVSRVPLPNPAEATAVSVLPVLPPNPFPQLRELRRAGLPSCRAPLWVDRKC